MSFWTAITGLVPRTSRGNVHPAVKVAGAAATIGTVTWLAIATPFVGNFEGYASKPYIDWNGSGHPETWCYGETAADGGPVPKMGTLFTKAECEQMLDKEAARYRLAPKPSGASPRWTHTLHIGLLASCLSRTISALAQLVGRALL